MKVPNLLTASRLVLAPLFLVLFLGGGEAGRLWALLLVIYFEVSDMVDGAVARRLGQTSQVGKILDPLADAVSRFTVFIGFLELDFAPLWAVVAIFYRDSIISTVRTLAASKGVILAARFSGKLKAIVQGTAIITLLVLWNSPDTFGMTDADVKIHAHWWMTGVAVVTLYSLVDYLFGIRETLRQLDA